MKLLNAVNSLKSRDGFKKEAASTEYMHNHDVHYYTRLRELVQIAKVFDYSVITSTI